MKKIALIVGIVIVAALTCSSITPVAVPAAYAGNTAKVTVNAPKYVKEDFYATIDVANLTDLNSAQFDLSFDSSMVNVTNVRDGSLDGVTVNVARWAFMDNNTIRVIIDLKGLTSVSGSGYLANISFEVVGKGGERSILDISDGMLVNTEAKEIPAEWIDDEIIVGVKEILAFDTGPGTYPSISGTHEGTITPNSRINVSKLYTYPCVGTGGHTEYVRIYGYGVNESASWTDYTGDWHNITFTECFTLVEGKTYNYTIKTGSYPQIHHTDELEVPSGTITCTKFTDANGKIHHEWIPAITLYGEKSRN